MKQSIQQAGLFRVLEEAFNQEIELRYALIDKKKDN